MIASLWRGWRDREGDASSLAVVRIAIGALLLVSAVDAARALEGGYFGDVFHLPFLPEAWVAPREVHRALVGARLLLAALAILGVFARPALLASATIALYTLLCDRLGYHHNRYALVCFTFLLAFMPCDRALALRPSSRTRRGPLWAVSLGKLQVALIYLASGGSKLLDPPFRDGAVLLDRFRRYGGDALAKGVPPEVVALFTRASSASALSKLAIATELFLAFALFGARTRAFALAWGLAFHLTIELTSKVELFTWLIFATYGFFVTPDRGARVLLFAPERRWSAGAARAVRCLDWFSRFRYVPTDDLSRKETLAVVDRDGERSTGVRGFASLARALPLLFPLWLPTAALASFSNRPGAKPVARGPRVE